MIDNKYFDNILIKALSAAGSKIEPKTVPILYFLAK